MNFDVVCVDASVAVAWLVASQANQYTNALRREWYEQGIELVGPPMFRSEVPSVLRGEVFFKRMLPEEGEEAFAVYSSIPIRIVDGPMVYRLAWELARECNQRRCYDMQYLAVAELEDCELLDRRQAPGRLPARQG